MKDWAKQGGESIEDDEKSGRPISVITPHTIDMVRNITVDDPHSTVAEIAHHLDISTGSVDDILLNHLEYRKVSSRWTPHTLTKEQKSTRVSCAKELLKMYEQADSRRLGEICTGDETWIMYAEPLRKIQNKTWLPKGAPPSTHPRPDFRAKKVLYCIFFDSQCIIASICVPKKLTVTGQYYAEECLGEVQNHYFSRTPSRGAKGIRLLHDNARPHKAKVVREMLSSMEKVLKSIPQEEFKKTFLSG